MAFGRFKDIIRTLSPRHKRIPTSVRLAFLCGSGISIPAGMPTTGEITSRILAGDGIIRHTDGNYYFGSSPNTHEEGDVGSETC